MSRKGHVSMSQEKPAPLEEAFEKPYWDGARAGELLVQRCEPHHHLIHPPMLNAPAWCGAPTLEWVSLGSEIRGTVYSWTVVHRSFTPGFTAEAPYIVALCEVSGAPGVRIMGNLLGAHPDEVSMEMPVKMVWEKRGKSSIPQWQPVMT